MDKIQKFFSDSWSVQRHEFDNAVVLLTSCLVNGSVIDAYDLLDRCKCSTSITARDYNNDWYRPTDPDMPEDAVAIIKIRGMLYAWETEHFISELKSLERNPNIVGVVLDIDGPGGMVSHVDELAELIAGYSKPTATVVTGVMASAHFWFGTAADRIYAASKVCEVGSVGTMITYTSYKKYYDQLGIQSRDIYPASADLKNRETRAADEGDDTLLQDRAARIHTIFADRVSANLGVGYDAQLPLFRGDMFTAEEAVALGYLDGFCSVDEAVRRVLADATSRKAKELFS